MAGTTSWPEGVGRWVWEWPCTSYVHMYVVAFSLQNDQRLMVIKEFLAPSVHSFTDEEQRFMDEARMVMKLNHRNVVTAIDLSQEDSFSRAIDLLHLCMEYCEGGDLRQVCGTVGVAVMGRALALLLWVGIGWIHKDWAWEEMRTVCIYVRPTLLVWCCILDYLVVGINLSALVCSTTEGSCKWLIATLRPLTKSLKWSNDLSQAITPLHIPVVHTV